MEVLSRGGWELGWVGCGGVEREEGVGVVEERQSAEYRVCQTGKAKREEMKKVRCDSSVSSISFGLGSTYWSLEQDGWIAFGTLLVVEHQSASSSWSDFRPRYSPPPMRALSWWRRRSLACRSLLHRATHHGRKAVRGSWRGFAGGMVETSRYVVEGGGRGRREESVRRSLGTQGGSEEVGRLGT